MCSTGITGQSSERGTCVSPKTYLQSQHVLLEIANENMLQFGMKQESESEKSEQTTEMLSCYIATKAPFD